jgi:hypothetical protein
MVSDGHYSGTLSYPKYRYIIILPVRLLERALIAHLLVTLCGFIFTTPELRPTDDEV